MLAAGCRIGLLNPTDSPVGESRRIRVPTATRWARGPAPFVYLKCAEERTQIAG